MLRGEDADAALDRVTFSDQPVALGGRERCGLDERLAIFRRDERALMEPGHHLNGLDQRPRARKLAYGLFHEPGRSEFWTFDLVNRRLRERVPFGGRPAWD